MKENDHRTKLASKLDSEQNSAEKIPIVKYQVRLLRKTWCSAGQEWRKKLLVISENWNGFDGCVFRRTNTGRKHIEKRGSEFSTYRIIDSFLHAGSLIRNQESWSCMWNCLNGTRSRSWRTVLLSSASNWLAEFSCTRVPRHRRFEKKAQVTLSSTLRRMANASTNDDLDELVVSGNQRENVQSLEAPEEEEIVSTEEPHHGPVSLASACILYCQRRPLTRLNLHFPNRRKRLMIPELEAQSVYTSVEFWGTSTFSGMSSVAVSRSA